MDLSKAIAWTPPSDVVEVTVIDSHTGGEPFRLVIGGLPPIEGATMLERRRFASTHLDWLRRVLVLEPRGHADMYGGWIGPPVRPDSDLSVIFVHNEGFSTMCGHGIIALTKIAMDTGLLPDLGDRTTIRVDAPAGLVVSTATVVGGQVKSVTFQNVPSYVERLDEVVEVEGIGPVRFDIAFGGAFYAYVDAADAGLAWPPAGQSELIEKGRAIKAAVQSAADLRHPDHPDLSLLYGVIFTGAASDPANTYRNVCVFADGEIDRSPTGTGVSGRIALDAARGLVLPGDSISVESIVGSVFRVTYVSSTRVGEMPALIPSVSGEAFITGRSTFWVDPSDPLGGGFLVR